MEWADKPLLSRAEIVEAYEGKITAGARSKLSKGNKLGLIHWFIKRLNECETIAQVEAACQAELDLLMKGYKQGSVANEYLPLWRKAVKDAAEAGTLTSKIEGANMLEVAINALSFPQEVYQELKKTTTAHNNIKQDNMKPVRCDRFVATARKMIHRDNPLEVAAGLIALTGRRFSEIVAKGAFKTTDHPYVLAFSGQLKKGDSPDAKATFPIATLIEAKEVLDAFERFRSSNRAQQLQKLDPEQINSKLNTSVRHHIKREFQATDLVPILKGEKSVSAHNLRGVYGAIAIHYFCPPKQVPHRFIQSILGHIIGETAKAKRKNAGATEHYFHYFLIGAQRQTLDKKGILLKQFGKLPSIVEAIDTTTTNNKPTKATRAMTKTKKGSSSRVDSQLMRRIRAIAQRKLNVSSNDSHNDVLEAVAHYLEDDKTQGVISSVEAVGDMSKWFMTQIDELKAENLRLRKRVGHAQARIAQGDGTATATPGTVAEGEVSADANTEPKKGKYGKRLEKRLAIAMVHRTVDSIMQWNNTKGRTHKDKWYISGPVIQEVIRDADFSISQSRVKTVLDERREEIEMHHVEHDLGLRHNAKGDKVITSDIYIEFNEGKQG